MGKAGRNEMKRVAANFLNGAAVALLTVGCIGPMVALDQRIWMSILAVLASVIAHALALWLVGRLED